MEPRFQITQNGSEVQTSDINYVGDAAALADDRVFAELFRMMPGNGSTVTKGVLSFTSPTDSSDSATSVDACSIVGDANLPGTIEVRPFRAFVGSRTAQSTDPKKSWRDIRSTIYVGSGSTRVVNFGGFADGDATHARWSLVYAVVTPDASMGTSVRYIKDPESAAVGPVNVTPMTHTTVTLAIAEGTASASPALPALPADGGGAYNIPICYIIRPPNVTSSDYIPDNYIYIVAPFLHVSRALGVATVRPATCAYVANQTGSGPAGLSTAALATWANTGNRPATNIQPNTMGSEKLLVTLDLSDASSANWSIANYGVVDSSRDWRNCIFSTWAQAGRVTGGTAKFSWTKTTANVILPGALASLPSDVSFATCIGQSFQAQMGSTVGFAGTEQGVVFRASSTPGDNPGNFLDFADGTQLFIYCDSLDGALKFFARGGTVPRCYIFLCIEATGPFPGR